MDRGKLGGPRKTKPKGPPPTGELIALGSKPTPGLVTDPKLPSQQRKASGTSSTLMPSSSSAFAAKKPKLGVLTPLGRPAEGPKKPLVPARESSVAPILGNTHKQDGPKKPLVSARQSSVAPILVPASELIDAILDAEAENNDDRVDSLIVGAINTLKSNKAKPDQGVFLSLMFLAKTKPLIFLSEGVTESFCSLLKRDVSFNFKSKGNPLVVVLTCNILMSAYQEEDNWPDNFVKVFVEDSLGERVWVDNPECREFVANIQTAFSTRLPPKSGLTPELGSRPPSSTPEHCPSPTQFGDDDDKSSDVSEGLTTSERLTPDDQTITPRYTFMQESIEGYILDTLKDQLTRRQAMDNLSRNLIRLMTVTCGYAEVRLMAVQRLEMWLQNPKLTRPAQELLMSVCLNCVTQDPQDVEVVSALIRVRLKTKPLINHYNSCMRELLNAHPENLSLVLKHTIYNELSNSRNPNNMSLLAVLFQHSPEEAAKYLAVVFQELLTNREDYLRAVRALLREIIRALRGDLNFAAFCRSLMQERSEPQFTDMEGHLKERLLLQLTDLICLGCLLSVTATVKEAASAVSRGDKKVDVETLRRFQLQSSVIQRDSVWWLHTIAPGMFKLNSTDYVQCIQKVLFMESAESYYSKDNWPPEGERAYLLRLVSEVPVQEDTLMRLLVIGLSRDLPLSAVEALDLADQVVRRAASLQSPGHAAWEHYPQLKCFMEMVMTNDYDWPPGTLATEEKKAELINKELQICELEKQEILEFESHLAAASTKVSITEANSLLISQLISMDPSGVARRPPPSILQQLRSLNKSLKLGHLLCRCRNPDFLLDIIQRQGTSQSMPWLAELVESSEGSMEVLPVQCLCEFLLHDIGEEAAEQEDEELQEMERTRAEGDRLKQKSRKQDQLRRRLQTLLYGPDSQPNETHEVLQYFLRRLGSQQRAARNLAARALSMLLSPRAPPRPRSSKDSSTSEAPELDKETAAVEEEDAVTMVTEDGSGTCPPELKGFHWLLVELPKLPHFGIVLATTVYALRQACQTETDPMAVSAYMLFLSQHAPPVVSDMADLALVMIVERPTIISHLMPRGVGGRDEADIAFCALLAIYIQYFKMVLQPQGEPAWSESQDQIFLRWSTGEGATMHILVVHAMIILLTYGEPRGENEYSWLLEVWFPIQGQPPAAYLVDTSEEALLLPDWLKLRMIRSHVQRLVDAALLDLDPAQLVLFVQSFGIPMDSMSKLLICLDEAVTHNPLAMQQAVVDKDPSYMSQLVEVQHMRGVVGGEKFKAFLNDHGSLSTGAVADVEMTSPVEEEKGLSRRPQPSYRPPSTEAGWMQEIVKLFPVDPGAQVTSAMKKDIVKGIQLGLAKEISSITRGEEHRESLGDVLIATILQLCGGDYSIPFTSSLHQNSHLSCPIFRLLMAREVRLSHLLSHLCVLTCVFSPVCSHLCVCWGGDYSIPFTSSLHQNSHLSCPIFRLLMARENVLRKKSQSSGFPALVSRLVKYHSSRGTLTTVLKQYHRQLAPVQKDINVLSALQAVLEAPYQHQQNLVRQAIAAVKHADPSQPLDFSLVHRVCALLCRFNSPLLEEFLVACLTLGLRLAPGDAGKGEEVVTPSHTQLLARMLMEQRGVSAAGGRVPSPVSGLLVDWLETSDTEIVATCPERQLHLLFSRDGGGSATQPYLLALLTHQTNYDTLHRCTDFLLQGQDRDRINSTAALDFLWACIHIPKVWQGRDTKVPQRCLDKEKILQLKPAQLCSLVDYILQEAVESCRSTSDDPRASLSDSIQARLPLLLSCCHGNRKEISSEVLTYLQKKMAGQDKDSVIAMATRQFLLLLYIRAPHMHTHDSVSEVISMEMEAAKGSYVQLDSFTHRLLSVLGNCEAGKVCEDRMYDTNILCRKLATVHPALLLRYCESGKVCEDRMYDTNILCRKLATVHPALLLRQLPMIAALLRGRVHLNFDEFFHRHHFLFFTHVLGLLELLVPHVFRKEHVLEDVLESYFDLLKEHYSSRRELGALVNKVIQFLHQFTSSDPQRAVALLQKHSVTLHHVSKQYPDLSLLKSLLAGISLPSSSSDSLEETSSSSSAKEGGLPETGRASPIPLVVPPASGTPWTAVQLAPFLKRIKKGQDHDDVLKVLHDLEQTSKRRVDVLEHFLADLKRLMSDSHDDCRNIAHNLVMRHIKSEPSCAADFLDSFLHCLDTNDHNIVKTTLRNLADYIVLCQEHANVLVRKAFAVGVQMKIDTSNIIADALNMLRLEGYND
ncbi:PREDICTED: integrator complex subunit 1-like [Branchiostoma belcheri]|uniref:Integrator complex subunit 1-like n=1 Tax=Branchiostoma belcheri TaxID=7741 RepID=A0A6P4YD98_BRABE|nr:PREDICTED: integrator complex subunit 1-like [Branchiostoma belcheri]